MKAAQKEEEVDELEDVIDPVEKKRLDRERELKADLSNAADLFGAVALSCKYLLYEYEILYINRLILY